MKYSVIFDSGLGNDAGFVPVDKHTLRSVEHGDRITATGQTFTMNMSGDHMGGDYKTDNHVTGEINLPAAGDWELRFTVRISEIDQATVLATVPIR